MLINVKKASISAAVLCFFVLSLVGWINRLSPYVCSKRALAGAAISYIVMSMAAKAINHILTEAMITSWLSKQKDNIHDDNNR